MRLKLLVVGGLLAVAIVTLALLAWYLPRAATVAAVSPADTGLPLAPPRSDVPVKDSSSPPDPVLEEDLKAIGSRLGQALDGHVLYNPPASMLVDEPERIEVRIAPADYAGNIRGGLIGPGNPQIETIEISAVMRVRLRGAAFSVDPPTGEAQAILPGRVAQWSFDVTPLRAGKQTLELEVSYLVKADGNSYPSTLPPFRREIEINIGTWHSVMTTMRDHSELVISTVIGITLGLSGFFLKLWYMERRVRKVRAEETVVLPARRKKRRHY